MLWVPWQLAQLATTGDPPLTARPWKLSKNVLARREAKLLDHRRRLVTRSAGLGDRQRRHPRSRGAGGGDPVLPVAISTCRCREHPA